jgi:hypothetical protein
MIIIPFVFTMMFIAIISSALIAILLEKGDS